MALPEPHTEGRPAAAQTKNFFAHPLDKPGTLCYTILRKRKERTTMKFIITYTSYLTHRDREVYYDKDKAMRRYEQLANCKAVTNLEMREI